MIGMILAMGSPFWPWQVLQVCKLSSSSSALAGRAKIARIVTAPAMVKMRILHIRCTALVSGRVAGTPGRDEAGVDGSNTCRGPACGASPDFESRNDFPETIHNDAASLWLVPGIDRMPQTTSSPLEPLDRRALAAQLVGDGRPRQLGDAGLDLEGVFERIPWPLHVRGRGRPVVADIVTDQGLRHAELGVGFERRIVVAVDLGDVGLEAGLVDQEMQMGRAHIGAALRAQEIAHR